MRDLCEQADPAGGACAARKASASPRWRGPRQYAGSRRAIRARPWLLAPVDLQAIKAAGVTFATSMLERVIEERARGDRDAAAKIRDEMTRLIGDDLSQLKPGSPAAMRLKEALIAAGRLVAIS